MSHSFSDNRPKLARPAAWLLAAASAAVLFSGATARAQSAPQPTGSEYRTYRSHVDWQGDCVAAPSAASDQPEYRVYQSHVAWRNDAVAANPASSPTGQKWEILPSNIGLHDVCAFDTIVRYDACSLHPTVMSAQPSSYSWNDITEFVAGLAGQRG